MKSVKDIKFYPAVLEWLHKEHIYIDTDSIGMHKMAVVGWFTHVHTHIIHGKTVHEKILESLSQVSITNEVLKLDASQHGNLQAANECGDEFQPTIPTFELFLTKIGSGSGKTCVVTDVIGVKCAVENFPLLCELFAQAANSEQFHYQFVPPCLSAEVSKETLSALIHAQNKYLNDVIGISVHGLSLEHLSSSVKCHAFADGEPEQYEYHWAADILYNEHWCEGIKLTNMEDKFIILTTKSCHAEVLQFLDKGLQEMWGYIDDNNCAKLPTHPNYPIPVHEHHNAVSTAMSSYASALWATVQPPPQNANEADMGNCHPPKNHMGCRQVQYIYSSEEFPSIPSIHKQCKISNNNGPPTHYSDQTQFSTLTSSSQPITTIPAAISNLVDLDALEQAIMTKFGKWLNEAVVQQVKQATAPMQEEINKISRMLQFMSEQFSLAGLLLNITPSHGTPIAPCLMQAPPPVPIMNHKVPPPPAPNVHVMANTCLSGSSFSFQSVIVASPSSSKSIKHQAMAVDEEADA